MNDGPSDITVKNPNRKFTVLGAIALSISFVIWRECVKKSTYSIGMSLNDAIVISEDTLRVGEDGCDPLGASPMELEAHIHFRAYDVKNGVELAFNHHAKLLKVRRLKWFGINFLALSEKFSASDPKQYYTY